MKPDLTGQDKERRGFSRLLIALIVLAVLCLSLVLVDTVRGSRANDGFVPFSIHALLQADYSAEPRPTPLSQVDLRIIREILKDRYAFADIGLLDAIYNQVLGDLKTPVPSVTPRFSPTASPYLSPTSSATPTVSSTPTQTPTASLTPSSTLTPTLSPTASLTPSRTPWTYPIYPTATRTKTPRPTATRTATPTKTATATATIKPDALLLDLFPNPVALNEPGGLVAYSLELENTISYSLTLVSLVDNYFGDLDGLGTCTTGGVIDPGDILVCTYPGTIAGNAGTNFTNQVTAVGRDRFSRTVTVKDGAVVSILDVKPGLVIGLSPHKTTVAEPGEVVTYTLILTNTSVESITLSSLSDDRFGNLDGQGDCETPHTIALGGQYSCVYSGLATGNAGDTFTNTVTAVAQDDEANPATDTSSASVILTDVLPAMQLALDAAGSSLPEPGGIMTYTLQVENLAVESLVLDSLVDSRFGDLDGQGSCAADTSIGSGAIYTCTYTGTLSGNAGVVFTNFVTVEARDNDGNPVIESDSASVLLTDALPALAVSKTAGTTTIQEPGSLVSFDIQVRNLGLESFTLTSLQDTEFGSLNGLGSCAVGGSLAGGGVYHCSFDGLVSGNAGMIHTNTLVATVRDDEGNLVSGSDSAVVTLQNSLPTVTLSLAADPASIFEPGGDIQYELGVVNTSVESVVLTSLSDDVFGDLSTLGCALPGSLGIGGSYTCAYSGTVSGNASDLLTNTVTVAIQDDDASTATAATSATVSILDALPLIQTTITASQTTLPEPGQVVTLTVQVENRSVEPVAVTSMVEILEGDLSGLGSCDALLNPFPLALAVGASYTCAFSASVAGDAGDVVDRTVSVAAQDDELNPASASATVTLSLEDVLPTVLVSKTASPTSLPEPGGTVAYSLVVSNTSVETATLTALVDDMFGNLVGLGSCDANLPISPGGVYACSFNRTLSGNAGGTHTNTASATLRDNEANLVTGDDAASVTFTDVPPAISASLEPSISGINEPGGTITYTLSVVNGPAEAVTLTGLLDDRFGDLSTQGCTVGTIPAGGTYTCDYAENVTGVAGTILTNTVTVQAQDDEGNPTSITASTSITFLDSFPTVLANKQPAVASLPEPGAVVPFTLTVVNTASESITLTQLVDDQFGDMTAFCGLPKGVALGGSWSCLASWMVAGNGGDVHSNTISVTAEDAQGNIASDTDSASILIADQMPAILVRHTPGVTSLPEPGGPVTYTLTITNTSVETVTLVSLLDDQFGNLNGKGSCATGGLIPVGNPYTCSYSGLASGNAGDTFNNQVTAWAQDDEANQVSANSTAGVLISDVLPSLAITKTANPTSLPEPGGSVIYSLQVDNTSVESASLLGLMDDVFGDLNGLGSCAIPTNIPSGGSFTCQFTQSVSGNAGLVHTNVVSATLQDDDGNQATAASSASVTLTNVAPSLVVTKTAGVASVYEPGDYVTYTVTVENTGVEAVALLSLIDDRAGDLDGAGNCNALSNPYPGAAVPGSAYTCQYALFTGGNAGDTVLNTVLATVEDDEGSVNSRSGTASVAVLNVSPTLVVTKTASATSIFEPGGSLTFTILVHNTSPETVTLTTLTDNQFGDLTALGCSLAVIPSADTYICSFSAVVNGEAGDVHTNTVSASAQDDDGYMVTASDQVVVSILDALPSLAVNHQPASSGLPEPGGVLVFSLQVTNTSPESIVLNSLASDMFGNLDGQGTCSRGGSIPTGGLYVCSYSGSLAGDAGQTFTNTLTVQALDNEANLVTEAAAAAVLITDVEPSLVVSKLADKTTIEEPGETVTFSLTVENTSPEDLTITSLLDDYSGNLDGLGTCSTPLVVTPGSTIGCSYQDTVLGVAGQVVTTTLTVTVQDNEANSVQADASVFIAITTRPTPTLDLLKSASPTTILEPGGTITFAVQISNTHSRDVVLDNLVDSVFGDLNGKGDCTTGGLIRAGESYTCQFSEEVLGNAGTVHTNLVTAEVNEIGAVSSDSDDAMVTISDAVPSLSLSKTADLIEVVEPGQEVTFQITITNTAVETVTLTSLLDSQLGSLEGVGTCSLGLSIRAGSTASCSYTHMVSGTLGMTYTNVVTAQVMDDETNAVSQVASVTLSIVAPSPADVSGQVREDLDFDGDLLDPDPGIAGVSLELSDGSCVLGANCLTTLTDSSGNYTFADLLPGVYQVVAHDLAGFGSTGDVDGTNDNRITLTLVSGIDSSGNDFLDTRETGIIYGQVRDDSDRDGDLGDNDAGLAGVTVSLLDGLCTLGLDCRTIQTDSGGNFVFLDLVAGEYLLVESDLPGYQSTADSDPPNDNQVRVALIRGVDSSGNVFLDAGDALACSLPEPITGYISATLPAEADIVPLSNGSIQVVFNQAMATSGGGSVLDLGNFDNKIKNLTTGGDVPFLSVTYHAQTNSATLSLDTSDADWQLGSQFEFKIKAGLENACGQNQGVDVLVHFNTQSGLRGQVRNDLDGDGNLADTEAGIPDVTLELQDGACTLGSNCRTTLTVADGTYQFNDLPAGSYTIFQYDLTGYNSTADADGGDPNQIAATLGVSQLATGLDFLDIASCSLPDPVTGYVSTTLPAAGAIVSLEDNTLLVFFDQAMSTSGGSVLDKANFDDKIKNLTFGGDVPFVGVSYVPQNWMVILTLDTSDPDWLPGSQYELRFKSNIRNACDQTQGVTVVTHFFTQSGITGQVRNDTDADGNLGDGDSGIPGVSLALADGSCTLGVNCRTAITGDDGNYRFVDLPAGAYSLYQQDLPGFSSTADVDGGDPNLVSLTLASTEYRTGQDFLDTGVCLPPSPTLGFVGSTNPSDGETLVPLNTETILVTFNQPMMTDGGGRVTSLSNYHDNLKNLDSGKDLPLLSALYDPGTYQVTLSFDRSDPDWSPGSRYQLEIDKGLQNACKTNQGVSVFIDFQTASAISGQVRWDTDGDGAFSDDDPGLPGITITLADGSCTPGLDCRTSITNSNGFFIFSNVVPGSYILIETNPVGFISTADTEGLNDDRIELVVVPGSLSVRHDFLDTTE